MCKLNISDNYKLSHYHFKIHIISTLKFKGYLNTGKQFME